jgi:release factor glutamine methyltransferase
MLIKEALNSAKERLEKAGVDSPGLDSEYLAAYVLGKTRSQLPLMWRELAEETFIEKFSKLVDRRCSREPLQYILTSWGFMDFDLAVGPGVLIPRPETEELVEKVIQIIKKKEYKKFLFADVGTGPGTIGIALARAFPQSVGILSDISNEALEFAQKNVQDCGVDSQISICQQSLIGAFAHEKFELIVSNPPYIDAVDMPELMPEVRDFEPWLALDGGYEGLDLIKELLPQAEACLKFGGVLAIEHGHGQREAILKLASKYQFKVLVEGTDLFKNERYLIWEKYKR